MSVWAIATSSIQERLQARFVTPVASARPSRRSGARRYVPGAPEIYFPKSIDNTRLVKLDDPDRKREMRMFAVAISVLFVLCTVYVWQHFRAIEYGYNIEAAKTERDRLTEENRALRMQEATLKDPERIDRLARDMGLQMPRAGQVQQIDGTADNNTPVMARAAGVSVVSLAQ
jgi:cell division protein FtsL